MEYQGLLPAVGYTTWDHATSDVEAGTAVEVEQRPSPAAAAAAWRSKTKVIVVSLVGCAALAVSAWSLRPSSRDVEVDSSYRFVGLNLFNESQKKDLADFIKMNQKQEEETMKQFGMEGGLDMEKLSSFISSVTADKKGFPAEQDPIMSEALKAQPTIDKLMQMAAEHNPEVAKDSDLSSLVNKAQAEPVRRLDEERWDLDAEARRNTRETAASMGFDLDKMLDRLSTVLQDNKAPKDVDPLKMVDALSAEGQVGDEKGALGAILAAAHEQQPQALLAMPSM